MLRYWMRSRAWFRSQLAKENHNKLKRTFWEKSLWQCRWMMKMSCHCGNGIHFFQDFQIRNSHFATVPHRFKTCVFNEHGFQSAGMFLSVLVNDFSPWSIDSLDQVIESTGNLMKHSSKLEASELFDMNLNSRVIQVWGSLESWAIPPWWNRSLLVSLLQDW